LGVFVFIFQFFLTFSKGVGGWGVFGRPFPVRGGGGC